MLVTVSHDDSKLTNRLTQKMPPNGLGRNNVVRLYVEPAGLSKEFFAVSELPS